MLQFMIWNKDFAKKARNPMPEKEELLKRIELLEETLKDLLVFEQPPALLEWEILRMDINKTLQEESEK